MRAGRSSGGRGACPQGPCSGTASRLGSRVVAAVLCVAERADVGWSPLVVASWHDRAACGQGTQAREDVCGLEDGDG